MPSSNLAENNVTPLNPPDAPRRFRVFTERTLDNIEQLAVLPAETRFEMKVVASVLPFRVNEYVLDELIDWNAAPDDPLFRLTFPQRGMLNPGDFDRIADLIRREVPDPELRQAIAEVRAGLNPHPAGQLAMNVPIHNGEQLSGLQHKYRETVLFFPSQGQTCHSYCTFCFRWAQFIGDKDLKMANREASALHDYLREHTEVSDLLMTGGDPMVMKTRHLRGYLEDLTRPEFDHIQTIRIGTKALTFWPQRFVTDKDADELIELLTELVQAGKHVAVMAHYNHWRELETDIARQAIERVRATGAQIRSQGPVLNNINNDPADWARMWNTQVRLGIVPYYMFVERDTGARHYFELPLARAYEVYREAMKSVSGLGRTARGPSMSAGPGKVEVQGITEVNGEKVFVLRFIQARNPDWVQRPFFARFDDQAGWLDQLKPAFGEEKFFFEDEYEAMQRQRQVALTV